MKRSEPSANAGKNIRQQPSLVKNVSGTYSGAALPLCGLLSLQAAFCPESSALKSGAYGSISTAGERI
jgi:hypothetical protein